MNTFYYSKFSDRIIHSNLTILVKRWFFVDVKILSFKKINFKSLKKGSSQLELTLAIITPSKE